jgi:hypothetical protein
MQILFPIGFFAFGLVSLTGQDLDELKGLKFNIGGGLSMPVNPTARYFGVNGKCGHRRRRQLQ